MAGASAQKSKESPQRSTVLDAIAELIERGRKPPTREELNELADLGKGARQGDEKQKALAAAESLRKTLNEAARHRDTGELMWG